MFIRKLTRKKDGKTHAYWALVESYRTARGPRQRLISYLGEIDTEGRLGVRLADSDKQRQQELFEEQKPKWVAVDIKAIRTERTRDFGDVWLCLQLIERLGLRRFLADLFPNGREKIRWADLVLILVIARFCDPKSELYIAEHFYAHTALADLLDIPAEDIYDNRLYRTLDKLLPHKTALECHLKERFETLFGIQYDILLYDVTSTYFEGEAKRNSQAKRGYSRDKRPDLKQVCIALIVTKEGIPLGYEVFAGNRQDVTTVEEIVTKIESQYGAADRIWVMDRGMISADNIDFLKSKGRRFIIGTPKSALKKFEHELLTENWHTVHEGLEVKMCRSPDDDDETYILCRSAQRREKEKAIFARFTQNIEDGLIKIKAACEKGALKDRGVAERRIGRLLERNKRAAALFDIQVKIPSQGRDTLELIWTQKENHKTWAELSEGCYLLRSNIKNWTAEELWRAYIHLTDAEAAFRIQKSDLRVRPIWHQKQERVHAHILVCFLAFVLWKFLAQLCKRAGLGDCPRKIIDEIKRIKLTDVVLPTKGRKEIRIPCVTKADKHQQILLEKLKLKIPARLDKKTKM
jgi:transposase